MKERKYILLLFLCYYFWTTISIRSSLRSHCYSWCHSQFVGLLFFFWHYLGVEHRSHQFIFISGLHYFLLFFSRAFSLKKVVRNFSYPLDKLKILLSLSSNSTLGWNKFQYMTDQNNIEGNVAEGIERKRFWHKKILAFTN